MSRRKIFIIVLAVIFLLPHIVLSIWVILSEPPVVANSFGFHPISHGCIGFYIPAGLEYENLYCLGLDVWYGE